MGVARVIVGWGVRGILEFVDELSWGGWVGKGGERGCGRR